MLKAMSKIAEQKIKEAQERGDFDNLPGKGKPQNLADEFRIPEEYRMAYTILKNAGCAPPEITAKNEIIQIEDMLSGIKDEQEKYRQIRKLNFLVTKLNTMRPRPVNLEEQQRYYSRIVAKMSIAQKKNSNDEKK